MNFQERPNVFAQALLMPPAGLYSALAKARNLAFDLGLFRAREVGKPVLSVGNLTAGGTGKTPLTAFLIETLQARGKKVGVVCRGYGGTEKGPVRVSSTSPDPKRFGDEPSWLAKTFPTVPVVIGRDRVAASNALIQSNHVDLILADDAFQHRWLKRALDLVILDATEPLWHYRPLPLGRLREGFGSLSRADAICITKTNLAPRSDVERLRSIVQSHAHQSILFEMRTTIAGFFALGDEPSPGTLRSPAEFSGERLFLVSGIGRPHTFKQLVEESTGLEICGKIDFPDHHEYLTEDISRISREIKKTRASALVVTEKDAVKLRDVRLDCPVWVSHLKTLPDGSSAIERFHEAVGRLFF